MRRRRGGLIDGGLETEIQSKDTGRLDAFNAVGSVDFS